MQSLTAPGMHVTEISLEFHEKRDIFGKAAEFQSESSWQDSGHEVQPPHRATTPVFSCQNGPQSRQPKSRTKFWFIDSLSGTVGMLCRCSNPIETTFLCEPQKHFSLFLSLFLFLLNQKIFMCRTELYNLGIDIYPSVRLGLRLGGESEFSTRVSSVLVR